MPKDRCLGCEKRTLLTAYLGRDTKKIAPVCKRCLPHHSATIPFSNVRATRVDDLVPWITILNYNMRKNYAR